MDNVLGGALGMIENRNKFGSVCVCRMNPDDSRLRRNEVGLVSCRSCFLEICFHQSLMLEQRLKILSADAHAKHSTRSLGK